MKTAYRKKGVVVTYRKREGSRVSLPADVVGPVIEGLKAERGGEISAGELVALSRPPDSPLHDAFEWDDRKAGEQLRERQARNLFECYVIEYVGRGGEPIEVLGNVCVEVRPKERRYIPVDEAMAREYTRQQVIDEIERMLENIVARCSFIPGMNDILKGLLRKLLDRLERE